MRRRIGPRAGAILLTGTCLSPAFAAVGPTPVLERLVVTAAERNASQKSAQSVVAIPGVQFSRNGAQGVRDYIDTIPSLNVTGTGNGALRYSIRGISALSAVNNDVATVGYYLDEVPISESQTGADIVPFDLQRIEVLRGPQATQFGESSLAGTIRVVTNKPDASRAAGAVQASASDTAHGGANQSVSAMLNLPLVKDVLAVRAVLNEYRDSGYLDNIVTHQNDVNSQRKDDARLALRWRPDARVTVDLTGLAEYEHEGGRNLDFALAGPEVLNVENLSTTFGLGRLSPDVLVPNTGPAYSTVAQFPESFTTQRQVINATVNDDLGWAQLMSSTSYYHLRHHEFFDSREDGQVVEAGLIVFQVTGPDGLPLNLVHGTPSDVTSTARAFSQEVRLASPENQALRWQAGAFYRYRENGFDFVQSPPDFVQVLAENGMDVPHTFVAHQEVQFAEYALFGQATYDITPALHLTGGARIYAEDVTGTGSTAIVNTFDPNKPKLSLISFPVAGSQHQKKALFRAALGYDVSADLHAYLLFSEGARPGGLNQRLITAYFPQFFHGDSTRNYEAGVKGNFLDHRLTASVSVFQIDWSNTQVYVATPPGGQNVYNLPDGARVRGAELEAAFALTPDLQLGGAYGWLESATMGPLTYFDSLAGNSTAQFAAGTQLPNIPHNKISLYADYGHDWGNTRTSLRVSDQYVTSSVPAFGVNYRLQPYNRLNAQFRLERGQYAFTLYADNLLDRIIEIASPSPLPGSFGIGIDRPRTVGLRIDAAF